MSLFTAVALAGVIMFAFPYFLRSRRFHRRPTPAHIFIAHWVEPENLRLKFSRWRHLHHDPSADRVSFAGRLFWTVASFSYLLSPMAYEIVDDFTFDGAPVQTWLVSACGLHFFLPPWLGGTLWRRWIRRKILRTIQAAHQRGVKVVGLGALTKDHQLTNDGQWFADQLRDDQRPRLMHGDTLTAATVFEQVRELVRSRGTSAVFLTGATSKIGRAVALRLAADGVTVYLHTESEERFARIQADAGAAGERLRWAPTLADLPRCDVCVTGKGTGGARLVAQAKPRTVFVNFSVPDPLSTMLLSSRDMEHNDGGLLAYDREATTLSFGMRLALGQTYACHAWLLVCAANGWTERDELGPVDVAALDTFWGAADAAAFALTAKTPAVNATAA